MNSSKKCNHIIGIGDGVDEWWYCYVNMDDEEKKSYMDDTEDFNYCPKCGEKLKEET